MLGKAPGLFWRVCWVAISPAFLAVRCVKYYTHISRSKLLNYNINKTMFYLWNIMITDQVQTKTKEENQKAVGHLFRRSYTAYHP